MRISITLILLIASSLSFGATPSDVAAVVREPPGGLAPVVSAHLRYRDEPPYVLVMLDPVSIRSRAKPDKSHHVVGYRVGLAHTTSTPAWEIDRWSSKVPLDLTLRGQEAAQQNARSFLIPTDGLSQPVMKDHWVVVELQLEKDGNSGWGTTYSHSN